MLNITHSHEHIKVDCDSYVLLKDAGNLYGKICDAFRDNHFIIKKWIMHEQVLDVLLYHLTKETNIDFTSINEKIYLFGIPIEVSKPISKKEAKNITDKFRKDHTL